VPLIKIEYPENNDDERAEPAKSETKPGERNIPYAATE